MDREEAQKASVAEQPNVADDVDDTRDTKNEHVEGDDDLRVEEDAGDNLDGPDGLAKDDETRDSNRGDIEDEGRADKRQTAEPLLLRLLEKFLNEEENDESKSKRLGPSAFESPFARYARYWNLANSLSKQSDDPMNLPFFERVKRVCLNQARQSHRKLTMIYEAAEYLEDHEEFFNLLLDDIRNNTDSHGTRRAEIFERAVRDAKHVSEVNSTLSKGETTSSDLWSAVHAFAGYSLDSTSDVSEAILERIEFWAKNIYPDQERLEEFKSGLSIRQHEVHELIMRLLCRASAYTSEDASKLMKSAFDNPDIGLHIGESAETMLSGLLKGSADLKAYLEEGNENEAFIAHYELTTFMITRLVSVVFMGYEQFLSSGQVSGHQILGPTLSNVAITSIPNDFQFCPWLRDNERDFIPHYLWDVKNQRSRTTRELMEEFGECPKYVAISHTWGRWRIKKEWVEVSGVDWEVPRITKFDVKELPMMLENLMATMTDCGRPIAYVWLDLVTIPQKGKEEIRDQEIARQASIFKMASHVIAWLNDIESWDRTQALLQWVCVNTVKKMGRTENLPQNLDSHLELLANTASHPVELCNAASLESRQTAVSGDAHILGKSNPWFTSLWTLQEAYLRPDMLIANNNWGLLEISTNVPVNLYDLIAVFRACEDYPGEAPTSLSGMVEVFKGCGLFDLTSLSRSEILIMGSRRECSKARHAEAIMSVLDVRDWFTGDPKSREADLVMNLYPWTFVEEVRRKIGCLEFFGSMINPDADEWKVVYTKIAHGTWTVEDPGIRGSLLPFGRHVLPSSFFGPLSLAIPHPTLCNWEINKDGSVKISEVALVMITDNGKPNCHIVGPDLYYDWKEVVQYDGNLPRILDLYFPEMPNYAVCLGIETITEGLRGVILKEVSAGNLIKVGNFLTRERVEGNEVELCYRQVNWILH